LPGFRTGAKPAPSRIAIAAPNMNPRASIAATRSIRLSFHGSDNLPDRLLQCGGVGQKWGYVSEEDARDREIGHVADMG